MFQRCALPMLLVASLAGASAIAERAGVRPLTGPHGSVACAAFSPDGKTLASGGADRVVRLYDAQTGTTRHQLDGAVGPVHGLAWASDGKLIAAAAEGSPLLAWTTDDGHLAWSVKLAARVSAVAIAASPDGKTLAVGYSDGTVRLHDAATGKAGRTLAAGKTPVVTVAWSPDAKLIGVANKAALQIWDGQTGKPLRAVPFPPLESVLSVAFAKDSKTLAASRVDGKLELWDAAAGAMVKLLRVPSGAVRSVAFSPEGDLVTGGADHFVRKWSGATGQEAWEVTDQSQGINAVAYTTEGKQLVSASDDGSLVVWDAYIHKPLFKLNGPAAAITALDYLAGIKAVASVAADGYVRVNDATTGVQRWSAFGHGGPGTAVASTPDGQFVITAGGYENPTPSDTDGSPEPPVDAAGSRRGRLMVWRTDDGQISAALGAHANIITALAVSPDGRFFVSGTKVDGDLLLWELATAGQKFHLVGSKGGVESAGIGPGAEMVASGGADGTLHLWNGQSGGTRQTIALGGPVEAVAVSPDGLIVATAGGEPAANGDHPIKLWDAATGSLVRTLPGHHSRIGALSFSRDGWYLLSASRAVAGPGKTAAIKIPSEARLWLVQTGALVQSVVATAEDMKDITSAAFAPDAHAIALGCTDQQIWLWKAK